MAKKQSGKRSMANTIKTVSFSKDNPIDRPLIKAANTFIGREENDGIPATAVLRNFIKRALDRANSRTDSTRIAPGQVA